LRTTFTVQDGQPFQVITPQLPVSISLVDLSTLPQIDREACILLLAQEEAQKPFDLQQGPLLRASLLRLSTEEHVLLLTLHHIITDGWSQEILLRELMAGYTADLIGTVEQLPPPPVQYADYAVWQRQWLQGPVLEEQINYWKTQLAEAPTVVELPTDKVRPAVQRYQGQTMTRTLPASLLRDLRAFTREAKCTLFMTLLAGFAILLERMSEQDDLIIGTVVSGRTCRDIEQLIGFFVNTLALRIDLKGDPIVEQVMERVRAMTLQGYAHQDIPFDQIVDAIQPERNLSHNPLVQILFILQMPSEAIHLPETELQFDLQPMTVESGTAKFDLALIASETDDGGLQLSLDYNSDLFIAESMQRLLEHYQYVLVNMITHPRERISRLEWLSQSERHQLLVDWNATNAPYTDNQCIHQLFEAQVRRTPTAVALVYENQSFTYRDVDHKANQLAHYLQRLGVGPEIAVGVYMERSLDMIVALIAVLKAGGAYIPLDPRYPQERLALMLSDSQPIVLLAQRTLQARLPECSAKIIYLDSHEKNLHTDECAEPPACTATGDNLAYIIYTSGTTGTPKGVLISHRSLCNVIEAQIRAFAVNSDSRILQSASFGFDASVSEIFMALLAGASLYLPPSPTSLLPDASLLQLLRDNMVTTVTLPPSALALLPFTDLPALQTLIVAGEECPVHLAKQWSGRYRMLNAYGPSETAICATIATCDSTDTDRLSIGHPIANTQVYVLDTHMQPLPVGIPGELYIGGVGVGRGYLNQPALTAERFVPDPFSHCAGARLYKTGDLVRVRSDGSLEFLGRRDHQVKLRGFRIELGEIEAVLTQQADVQDVTVILREDTPGDKRLVAYIVPRGGNTIVEAELRSHLQAMLPEYMIPAHFVLLDALPLTPSGKVDRRALPRPEHIRRSPGKNPYIGPRDHIEWEISRVWEQILGIKRIGVRDNFFNIGGNSLLAVRLLDELEQALGSKIALNTLFQESTIEYLARIIRNQRIAPHANKQSELMEFYPASVNRERLPFFCVHPSSGDTFAYADLARCIGSDQPFYAFQSRGLDGQQEPFESIEKMAECYISSLRLVQPHGPYLLGGWSMGGIVAYEMAQQLLLQREEVAMLAMLDATILPAVEGGDAELAHALLGKELPWEQFIQLTEEEQMEYLLDYKRQVGLELPDTDLLLFRHHMRLFDLNSRAVRNYTPRSYPGDMMVFRCRDAAAHIPPDLAWGQFVTGEIYIYEIPGDHHSLMLHPNVEELAKQLRACLDEMQIKHREASLIRQI